MDCKHYGGRDNGSLIHDGYCRLTEKMVKLDTCKTCKSREDKNAQRKDTEDK